MGRANRDAMNKTMGGAPGPGQYSAKSAFDGKNGPTMQGRYKGKKTSQDAPGPGQYN